MKPKTIFLTATLILLVPFVASASQPCVTIEGGGSSSWTICDDAITTNGSPTGGLCASGSAGSGASIQEAEIPEGFDAFDDAAALWVDDSRLGGRLTRTGNRVRFAPQSLSGLIVQMTYDVLTTEATLRNFVSFQNASSTPITVELTYANNHGSDDTTRVDGSSNGDLDFSIGDTWVATSDGLYQDPAITTVLGDSGTMVPPSSVAMTVFECTTTDGVMATFSLNVPAGQSVAMVFFHRLAMVFLQLQRSAVSGSGTVSTASDFDTIGVGSPLLDGLSQTQLAMIINLGVGGGGIDIPVPEQIFAGGFE